MSNTNSENPANNIAPPSQRIVALSSLVRKIESIVQTAGTFSISPPQSEGDAVLTVSLADLPAKGEFVESGLVVTVEYEFKAYVKDPGEKDADSGEPAVDVRARFVITYQLKDCEKSDFNSETLSHFASVNGRFNASAYWREYLNNCLVRAGFPPYMLPPFDAAAKLREIDRLSKPASGEEAASSS